MYKVSLAFIILRISKIKLYVGGHGVTVFIAKLRKIQFVVDKIYEKSKNNLKIFIK